MALPAPLRGELRPGRVQDLESTVWGLLRGRGLSKLVISRDTIRVSPFRALITLLITYLVSPLPLQVRFGA